MELVTTASVQHPDSSFEISICIYLAYTMNGAFHVSVFQERGDGVNDYREFLEDTGVPEIIAVAALDRVCRSVI